MKSFKQHLEEHSGHFSRQWLDQDTIPSAPHALEALNSLIGQMAEQEYLNPYGDFKEGDGISDHIEGGVSLVIDVTNSGDGKSLMNAQLVRNMDSEPTTPVDQIKVKDKG